VAIHDSTEIPAWARWMAQDADGGWWAYEHEPNLGDRSWYENEVGRSIKLFDEPADSGWKLKIKQIKE